MATCIFIIHSGHQGGGQPALWQLLWQGFEMACELVQIVYSDELISAEQRKKSCYPFARIYENTGLTIFFENQIIKEQVLATTKDKIAVCSWELQAKMRWNPMRTRVLTQEILESGYQVLAFTNNTENHNMLAAAEMWHPGFIKTFDLMLEIIGQKRPLKVKTAIYQNHFSAQSDIYKDYIKTYLDPAMKAIENDKGLNSMAMVDARYSKLKRSTTSNLQKYLGINYYPLVPFLLERLFSIYAQNLGLNITLL